MMLKRLFMNTSLRMRMIVLYTLFAVILVGGITLYSYHFTVDLLKKKEMAILSDSLEYLEKDISTQIKGINGEFIRDKDARSEGGTGQRTYKLFYGY